MPDLPNPFDSGARPLPPDEAVASLWQTSGAAADISEPTTDGGGPQESPAADAMNPHETAGDLVEPYGIGPATLELMAIRDENERQLDLIREIFAGARKLEQLPGRFDQAAYTPADELAYVELKLRDDPYAADLIEIPAGMWLEFDPPPLFIQQQMRA